MKRPLACFTPSWTTYICTCRISDNERKCDVCYQLHKPTNRRLQLTTVLHLEFSWADTHSQYILTSTHSVRIKIQSWEHCWHQTQENVSNGETFFQQIPAQADNSHIKYAVLPPPIVTSSQSQLFKFQTPKRCPLHFSPQKRPLIVPGASCPGLGRREWSKLNSYWYCTRDRRCSAFSCRKSSSSAEWWVTTHQAWRRHADLR